jgi:hypothetical protein
MEKITVKIKKGVLKHGLVPHGLAEFEFKHPSDEYLSFSGIGIFNEGVLNDTPFICINPNGVGQQFLLMENGRPASKNCI